MNKYGDWVRELSDDELVKKFELGVKVNESVTLSVDTNQTFMKNASSSQMQPIKDTVFNIEQEIKSQVNTVQENVSRDVKTLTRDLKTDVENALAPTMKAIQDTMNQVEGHVNKQVLKVQENLTTDFYDYVEKMAEDVRGFRSDLSYEINNMAARLPALDTLNNAINESEKRITNTLDKHEKKLESISTALQNPSKKGAREEKDVPVILNQNLGRCNFTFIDTSREQGKGDIEAETSDGHKIMIEVKSWTRSLPIDAIESFERNLVNSLHLKVGILLSMSGGITNRSKGSSFEVSDNDDQKQYMIYVPKAYLNNEEHLIVYSVLLAAQLTKMQVGELGEKKTQELRRDLEEFQKVSQRSKDCRANLAALKTSMRQLEDNVVPIFDIVEKRNKDISKLLH